ncbi:MAG: prolipoprotein diacylglyceryl transferase [Candidatus Omnitrophota bacterium]|nr:prolipoprotein diacylglyceryl transferase [Candidatus Omnitrophota bacterium]
MCRVLLQFGPVTIYSYGAMMVVAFVTATWLAGRAANRLAAPARVLAQAQIVDLCCLAMLGGVVGARLFFVVQHWEVFIREPLEIPAIWHGGLVWYGGFLGGLLSIVAYLQLHAMPVLRGIDQIIPFVPLGHALGRVGCFLNGCCYGKPIGQTQVPTQLLESVSLLVLFLVLRRVQQRHVSAPAGRLFGLYLIGYAVIRFFIEFLRGDQTVAWAGLTLQQLLSIGALLAGGLLIAPRPRRHVA